MYLTISDIIRNSNHRLKTVKSHRCFSFSNYFSLSATPCWNDVTYPYRSVAVNQASLVARVRAVVRAVDSRSDRCASQRVQMQRHSAPMFEWKSVETGPCARKFKPDSLSLTHTQTDTPCLYLPVRAHTPSVSAVFTEYRCVYLALCVWGGPEVSMRASRSGLA